MTNPSSLITYKEFLKNPIVGILFLSLFAISYLYLDNKSTYKNVIQKQETRIEKLEGTVMRLENQISKRDSIIMIINTKIKHIDR